jgi:hypothetical protein
VILSGSKIKFVILIVFADTELVVRGTGMDVTVSGCEVWEGEVIFAGG